MMQDPAPYTPTPGAPSALVRRHLALGWWSILAFLSLGMLLEAMHGLKLGWYLNVSNETRRLMWRLAHAHGVLIGLLHVAFALTMALAPHPLPWTRRASRCLTAAGVLLPLGFLLGGVVVYAGDPFFAILLVPLGALFLGVAVFLTARGLRDFGAV